MTVLYSIFLTYQGGFSKADKELVVDEYCEINIVGRGEGSGKNKKGATSGAQRLKNLPEDGPNVL